MKKSDFSRRHFITAVTTTSLAAAFSNVIPAFGHSIAKDYGKLAILGGTPVRTKGWINWPAVLADEKVIASIVNTTKSGKWSRIQNAANGTVATFEKEFAALLGVGFCVGTGSGTQALSTCVEALGIGPGDEVITSPYTDFGTISSIIGSRALPVMADLDRASYQLDPDDVEKKINKNTKAIMPVHMMGMPADMQRIMGIAKKHNLYVIEDACQANFAQYQGKQVGTIGDLGCFSFQASKQISCGEGGAVIGNDAALMDKVFTVQNHGTDRKGKNVTIGPKYRMNELEGAILMGQLSGAKERFARRNENAAYLSAKLKGFPGLIPQKQYTGTQSSGYYLYAMSYQKEHFNNADRSKFLKAIAAEGVALSPYIKGLHTEPWVDHILSLKEYKTMYTPQRLVQYREQALNLPKCDLVGQEMVVLGGSAQLLGTKADMDDVINAIMKVYENRDKLNAIE
ncbi:DegT/DnrJ/EryC1/StrS family aminotransferase [Pedobacter heparinus]|uniref:Glutamine--scyllo-inositol transaminase n=1 Tax=Pedobacter heparinus (strain ATCC 13125 / DSM 2366 / CIP 104194 / JCM 7457 / NBRC 12017 / NCIMB 9290 / NRRL B-14731 / HIM 762-3) TaxID=485917 RepID=C6XZ94_PEDHD|nr:DegT/DnrJ/EryC1/StrS family aminotransferase [Pedobacter heparinus]ACU02576.1 Glutamine--scyllo-inositol transaminase [Pedobacter heparinus DSM 2366]